MAIRRLLLLISVASLMFPMAANVQDPSVEAFERSPLRGAVDPVLLPNGIDDTRLVSVMVELEGDPVAVVQAKARRTRALTSREGRDQGRPQGTPGRH